MPARILSLALLGTAHLLCLPRASHAQDCDGDGDCYPGQVCSSDGFCDRAPCDSAADCPMGFGCEESGGGSADCPPGAPCVQPPPEMTCRAPMIPCQSDADCPTGLNCVDDEDDGDDCAVSSDGEVSCASDGGADRACAFVPIRCETDAECEQAGFECVLLDQRQECEDGATAVDCAPGADCPEPPMSEPQCETTTLRVCFPARRDCTGDAQCGAEWGCLELRDDDDVPPAYEGADAICVPEGLKLVATDQIDSPDVDLEDDFAGGRSGSVAQAGRDTATDADADEEAAEPMSGADLSGDDGGLCSAAPGQDRSGRAWAWASALLGALVWLRRARQ